MVEIGSTHQRTATLSKTAELQSSVFVKDYGYIPLVVANAAYVIEKNLRTKGLFQTKGTASNAMTKLMIRSKSSSLKTINVHDAVEALKIFLVSVPDPLLPDHVLEALISVPTNADSRQYVSVLTEFSKCWPYHFAVLYFVMTLLSKVSKLTLHNGADVPTLAIVFVFDIIRPRMRDNSETTGVATDLMQRLPFLIMVMETLIENPDLFKMAAAVGDDLIPEFEREQYKAQLMSAAKECSKVEPVICSWSSNTTYSRPLRTASAQTSAIPALNDPAHVVDTVQPGPQEATDAFTVGSPAEINTMNSRETKGNIQNEPTMSSAAAFVPFVNNGTNLLLAADSEGSASQVGILKTSKFKSSPGRKPVRASRPKKAAITRRQKAGTYYSNKRFAKKVEENKSDSSPSFRTLLLQENTPGMSAESCQTDDTNNTMTARTRCPQILDAKMPASKTLEDLVDGEKMAEDSFNSSQTFPVGQDSAANNDREPLTLIPDNRESADTETDSVIHNKITTVNTHSRVLHVPRKGMKHRRKGKLSVKKNRKRLNLKSRSKCSAHGCLSISPLLVKNKDPQRCLERISKTSSCVLFSLSTKDNTRTISSTNIRGSTAGDSDDYCVAECPKIHHRMLATRSHCENHTGHSVRLCSPGCRERQPASSCSPGCRERQPASSCSQGCCTRHSAGCSDLLLDDTTRNSDKSMATGTHCANNARCFVSGNDQEQPSGKKAEAGTNSPSRLRNEIQARRRSPFLQCTPCTNHVPKDLQQIIIVKVFNDPRRILAKARPRPSGNQPLVAAQRLQNSAVPEGSSIGSSLENLFMMSITLFIISLVLYHLSNGSHVEDFYE